MATSGPGATNLITAIATSYYDSTSVLYITGNVATFRFGAPLGVRQYGFQETDIASMVKKITKYALTVVEPDQVIPCLQMCIMEMQSGRKGPGLIDIPDDVQRADI